MKQISILATFVVLLTVAALPAFADPASAVGERLIIRDGMTELTAGEPFHVRHGFKLCPSSRKAIGAWDFVLELDGIAQESHFYVENQHRPYGLPGIVKYRWWLTNYPEGLPAGEYAFTGTWFAPCQTVPGAECDTPNESAVLRSNVLTVTVSP